MYFCAENMNDNAENPSAGRCGGLQSFKQARGEAVKRER
jgi:hypothetical protein